MPEINVTRLITDVEPSEISGSIAERGQNAGAETWANAMEATADEPLVPESDRASARKFFQGFGAWTEEEIAAWSDNELDAIVLQYAAGDLRELQSLAPGDGLGGIDWEAAQPMIEEGICSGSVYASGDQLFVSLEP